MPTMGLKNDLATNLRRIREEKGFSQEGLAHDADVDRTYVGRLENRKASPGLEIVEKLARILGVAPYELLMPPPRKARPKSASRKQP